MQKKLLCVALEQIIVDGDYPYIIGLGDDDEYNGGLPIRLNDGYPYFATGFNVSIYDSKIYSVNDNKWHFACLSFDSKTAVFYIDNKVVYAKDMEINMDDTKFTIGAHKTGRSKFTGDISDIRVYNKGLNFEEIYRVYQNIKR